MEKSSKETTAVNSSQKESFKKFPLGVLILGGINLFIFGILSFIVVVFLYQSMSSSGVKNDLLGLEKQERSSELANLISEEIQKYAPEEKVSEKELKAVLVAPMGVSVIYAILGLGLILRKEIARKGTIYFAFFIAILVLLSVLANPRNISHAIMQLIYPGILIYYFTSEKSIKYFNPRKKTAAKGEA